LLVYDFDKVHSCDDLSFAVKLKMIDFAHVFSAEGRTDENFLQGLSNFAALFQNHIDKLKILMAS